MKISLIGAGFYKQYRAGEMHSDGAETTPKPDMVQLITNM